MRYCLLLYTFPSILALGQQSMSIGSISQKGTCTVAGVTGNVTIHCPGISPSTLRVLNRQFAAQLKERDVRIETITKDANDWRDKYLGLVERLANAEVGEGLQRKAEELLKEGKLDEAGRVLDEVIDAGEKKIDQIATNHFNRAVLFELRFEPQQALPHYKKAYDYRPNNPIYGDAYATLLEGQGDFGKAEFVFNGVLETRREMAKKNAARNIPYVASVVRQAD